MITGLGKRLQSDSKLRSRTELNDPRGEFVTRRLDELHRHPSYARHHFTVPASKLSVLAERGGLAFREPLVITQDCTIVDGYARLELARLTGRQTLQCIEYELTEAEALHLLLERHRRSDGLSAFSRVLLALDLEPSLREKALSNQRAGGHDKGSSKLTEAGRVDVRLGIAKAAGVCAGNVTKVKRLLTTAHPKVLEALRGGEIRIDRAWRWSKEPSEKQVEMLRVFRSKRGIGKAIRNLISRHNPRCVAAVSDLESLLRVLSSHDSTELRSVSVSVVKASGKAVYVTEELVQAIASQKELFRCEIESH
jgi:hypothetical protein